MATFVSRIWFVGVKIDILIIYNAQGSKSKEGGTNASWLVISAVTYCTGAKQRRSAWCFLEVPEWKKCNAINVPLKNNSVSFTRAVLRGYNQKVQHLYN